MARNEYGEVELVLGTKQLIGVFMVVVILLALFASMGYIIGISSGPRATETAKNAPAKPIVVAKPTDQDVTPGDDGKDQAAGSESKPSPTVTPLPPPTKVEEEKSKPSPMEQPAPTKPAEKAAKVTEKQAEKATDKGSPDKSNDTPRLAISDPPAGQYWQVMAAERADAELIAEELSKKGMKALLAPAPKSGYYRVLVGPFSDAARMAEIRTNLESAGFKQPIVRKY